MAKVVGKSGWGGWGGDRSGWGSEYGSEDVNPSFVCVGAHRVFFGASLPGGVSRGASEKGYCAGCCRGVAKPHPPALAPGLPKIIRWAHHHPLRNKV